MKRKNYLFLLIGVLLVTLIIGEFVLRNKWGLGNAPLFYSSKEYEYMAKPNQSGVRFGNHYAFNSFSQRSGEPNKAKKVVLGLGDSVLFGGVMTDQDSIATSLVTQQNPHIQMLNISAGSWGPDNCAAYLKKFGIFNAKAMILLVSSHDAHDTMDFKPVVGIHPSYPDKQYALAWLELFDRYLIPRYIQPLFNNKENKTQADPDQQVLDGINIQKTGKDFNPGFDQLKAISEENNIPLIVILHADKEELKNKKYNEQGQEIINWASNNNIPLYQELNYTFDDRDYRDGIHTNARGQKKEASIMNDILRKYLQ